MPRGRKRSAKSKQRVEPRTTSREPVGPSKKPRQASRQTADKRSRVKQSASSRSPSPGSDWSSSRERKESKQRREIAKRARATNPPRRKAAPRKSKKKEPPKKPASSVDSSGDEQDDKLSVIHHRKTSDSNIPSTASQGHSTSDQPGTSCGHENSGTDGTPPEDTSSDGTVPCCFPRCPWRGSTDALPDHVDQEHSDMVLSGPVQQFEVPVTDPQRGAALSRVVRAFGEMFAVHFRRAPKANLVLGCVQLLGPPERACDFVYQMEVRGNGEDDPPLQHCPIIANTSSSREFEIVDTLKQVCTTEQADADTENGPNWGNREVITVEVKISTPDYCDDPDEETANSSPPPELSFMWM